jgi:hypothetical protein
MVVEIVPYSADHIPFVREFNARLRAGGVPYSFPESDVPAWLPPGPGASLYQEYFVAVEDDAVRAGYILKHQEFWLCGESRSIGNFQLPLSEGTIDRRHTVLAARLLRDALRRQPVLYVLGIGGTDEAAARLLQIARFGIATVPFYFRVEHAARFFREIRLLRASTLQRLAGQMAATTRLGDIGLLLLQRSSRKRGHRPQVEVAQPDAFDESADVVWKSARDTILLGAVRDSTVLRRLYDTPRRPFIKVAISAGGEPCGWAVCLATQGTNHKYFGDLKVGSIVDLLARPGYESDLIVAAVQRLRREQVDLIVTNQSLKPVRAALRGAGFLRGRSNFLFAASPRLLELITPLETNLERLHLNRGDGDGPINL